MGPAGQLRLNHVARHECSDRRKRQSKRLLTGNDRMKQLRGNAHCFLQHAVCEHLSFMHFTEAVAVTT